MKKKNLIEKAVHLLQCPDCRVKNTIEIISQEEDKSSLVCNKCNSEYPIVDGIIDFIPEIKSGDGLSQKLMENKIISLFYEKYFRPIFTRIGSPITYNDEVQWLTNIDTKREVKTILDLACGTGKYSRFLNKQYQPEIVISVDISMPCYETV